MKNIEHNMVSYKRFLSFRKRSFILIKTSDNQAVSKRTIDNDMGFK
jgi:hypothetical protein